MANIKISALPSQTATTIKDIVAIVDSGYTTTSKIELQTLFRASGSTITQTDPLHNNMILASSNSTILDTSTEAGDNAIIASTNTTIDKNQGARAAIIASNEVRISNDSGEGAMNCIIASFNNTTEVEGGFGNTIISSNNGAKITRGERNAIIGGAGTNIQYGGNQVAVATNGWNMNGGYNNFVASSESGNMSNHRYTAVIGNYIFNESDSGNQCMVAAGENNTLSSRGGFASWKSIISGKETTSQDEGASMISTSGRSSNYPWTLHTDNTYVFGHETHPNTQTTTISNIQYFNADLGMIQYCDVAAGNLNFEFQNVRNGEMYRWVIDNTTGGVISLNSVAVPVGFTYVDDTTGGNYSTGIHTFFISVIKDLVIVGHYK